MTQDPWQEFADSRDPGLRARLITGNIPLIKYVASGLRQSLPAHVDADDLVSMGTFGLIDAVDRFDPERGVRFEAFAIPRIRGAILDGLRALDWAPRSVRSANRDINKAVTDLVADLGRQPTTREIADHLGLEEREVSAAWHDAESARVGTLTMTSHNDHMEFERHPADHAESDHATSIEWSRARELFAAGLAMLPAAHQAVVHLHYGRQMKLKDVGRELGISQGRATRLYTEACLLLREALAVVA